MKEKDRDKVGEKRKSVDKNAIFFFLRCQIMTYTSLQNMQIRNTELHCSIYHNTASRHTSKKRPEDNPPESTSHRNIPIIQAYLSEQAILISTFPGRAVVRKESISLLLPLLTPHQWRSSPSGHMCRNANW